PPSVETIFVSTVVKTTLRRPAIGKLGITSVPGPSGSDDAEGTVSSTLEKLSMGSGVGARFWSHMTKSGCATCTPSVDEVTTLMLLSSMLVPIILALKVIFCPASDASKADRSIVFAAVMLGENGATDGRPVPASAGRK